VIDANSTTTAFTIQQVKARTNLGRDGIYKAIADGPLPARKFGKRTLIIAADLEKFLQSLPQLAGEPTASAAILSPTCLAGKNRAAFARDTGKEHVDS
jgi:excisionase family DNA binding protein